MMHVVLNYLPLSTCKVWARVCQEKDLGDTYGGGGEGDCVYIVGRGKLDEQE
jgi:hypothetical protein